MDDLTRIPGIGQTRADKLKSVGITSFKDITALNDAKLAELDTALELRGAADTNNWREAAQKAIDEDAAAANPDGDAASGTTPKTPAPKKAPAVKRAANPPSTATPDEDKALKAAQNTGDETQPDEARDARIAAAAAPDGSAPATGPVPRGAVTATPDSAAPALIPLHSPSPDQRVENAQREADEAASRGSEEAPASRRRLDEGRPFGTVHGSVEGYDGAVMYEQDGKFFGPNKIQLRRS